MRTSLRFVGIASIFVLLITLTVDMVDSPVPTAEAAGAWNGQDLLHVPMAWCIVNGSPAQANPSILGLNGTLDSNTDAVIWRRHERPTDNIYTPQAGISLRSAINNAWGSFNFPLINDPDTTNGAVGDVNGWDVNNDGAEFNALINSCDAAYSNIGRAGIGITAVNVGLFHDNANPANDGDAIMDYVGIIGWAGCNEFPAGTCVAPYDGRVMVIDNQYLYPTEPDRTFPPSPADPLGNIQFTNTDSLDILTGHEVGHALSLDHRNNTQAMMNPSISDNNGDSDVDNTNLNNTEINALRANALNVPGLETDPPGEFKPGDFLAMRLVDQIPETGKIPAWLDLASVKVAFNQGNGDLYMTQQLMGLIPGDVQIPPTYAFLADTDNNQQTGVDAATLRGMGIASNFPGADLIALANTDQGPSIGGQAWSLIDGKLLSINPKNFDMQIQTLVVHPQFADIKGRPLLKDFDAEVNHTISFRVDRAALANPPALDKPFRVQAVVMEQGEPFDRLDDEDFGRDFVFELPTFPHCFPQDGLAGTSVEVTFDGLLPNREIHALLGPDLVLDGVITDANGNGTIQLPLPAGAAPGLRLVTIGHDGLALTADCTVEILAEPTLVIPDGIPAMTGQTVTVPVILNTNGADVAAVGFSVDFDEANLSFDPTDANADGVPDSVNFLVPATHQAGVIVDLTDTDGELDFAIFDISPPITSLPDGVLAEIEFLATGDPGFGNTLVAPVKFSTAPAPDFADSNSVTIPGTSDDGSVIIMGRDFGDCNGDGVVNIADTIAVVLEFFDGDGNDPNNTHLGTFPGNPGCDANEDGSVLIGDTICVVLIFFNGPGACGGGQGAGEKFFGLLHRPLGQATLAASGDNLVVSNIGSSGLDGVSVELPVNAMSWTAELEPLDSAKLPIGAELVLAANAAGEDLPIGVASAIKSGDNSIKMTARFPLLGAGVGAVEVWNNGERVAVVDDDTIVVPDWPIRIDPWIIWLIRHELIFIFEWDDPGPIRVGGQEILGDEVRFIPEVGMPKDMMTSSVDVTGKDLGSMTIVGEVVMPVE